MEKEYVQMPFFKGRIPTNIRGRFLDLGAYKGEVSRYVLEHTLLTVDLFDLDCSELDPFVRDHPRVTVHEVAVSSHNGRTRFVGKDQGRTIFAERPCRENLQSDHEVDVIYFAEWMDEHVNPSDFIVMKMDVEGEEYKLILSLVEHDLLGVINLSFVDWHVEQFDITQDRHDFTISRFRHTKQTSYHWIPGRTHITM